MNETEETEETEERLRVMLDTLSFACYFFDAGGMPIDCNQRALSLFGCEDKGQFLERFFDFSPEYQSGGKGSREQAAEYIRLAFQTGKQVFTWEHRKSDGTPLPSEITLIRINWKGSHRIVAYARDLSILRETEDNLRRILSVVEGSPNLILYINASGRIEYANPALSELTGFSRDELLKSGLEGLFRGEDLRRLKNEFLPAAMENRTVHFEMELYGRNNAGREFAFSAFAADLHGGRAGVGVLGRDVSELKGMQRELVAAREQVEQALIREQQYSKAKSDFLSRVSHELRTPMNTIIGMTGIARKAVGMLERERYFEKIEEASQHLLEIVNDILDMTGFDSGVFDWEPESFSFSAAIRQISSAIQRKAAAKGQRFTTEIDSRIPDTFLADERRLRQILLTLLDNAVKFTPEQGAISLSAELLAEQESSCRIRFVVSDTGIGIPEQLQKNLWDVFEQGDNSITRQHSGLGLGLPLVERIVKLMNGSIRLESEAGKGSRFICDLCLDLDLDLDNQGNREELQGGPQGEELDLSGKRILVVDDIETNREILAAILEETGAVIDEAQNGVEGVSIFSQNKYDLVLMDLHMPVMNGFDSARGIRSVDIVGAATVPIIAISADSGPDLHGKCLSAGINDHLVKPVNMLSLYRIIRKWLPRGLG
jgi:PAS domain S-box-containing protein